MQGRLEGEIKRERNINNTLSQLPQFVTEWYYNLKASKKTAASCIDYTNKIRRFLTYINSNPKLVTPNDITLSVVQQYFISIQTKEDAEGNLVYTSDSYQQTVWCCLNNLFDFLVETNQMDKNHMKMITKPKNKDLDRINEHRILLTKKDFNAIINAVKEGTGSHKARAFQDSLRNRDMAIIFLFMTTGMRKTALSEINISDLDMDNEVLYVVDKGNKKHSYKLSDKTYDAIYWWLEDREDILDGEYNDALFISDTKERLSSAAIYKLVCKYCEGALGYHISPHKLRAGFCSILYNETGDVEFVRRAVGHSNVATTQRYIVTKNVEKEKAVSIIDGLLK